MSVVAAVQMSRMVAWPVMCLFQGERVHTSCHITVPTLIVEITFIPVAFQLLSAVLMHRN